MAPATDALDPAPLQASLGPQLTAVPAEALFEPGPEAVGSALLAWAQRSDEKTPATATPDPAAPSGPTPPQTKPARKRPAPPTGARPGHPGHRRSGPPRIDRRQQHTPWAGPVSPGPVRLRRPSRARILEDIPADLPPIVTEPTSPRPWCPPGGTHLAPTGPEAPPGATLGRRGLARSAWLHSRSGTARQPILDVFQSHRPFPLTAGGSVALGHRLGTLPFAWDQAPQERAIETAVGHADEPGGRVQGKAPRLWCSTSHDLRSSRIDRRRGPPALKKSFKEEFAGTPVPDSWGAYDAAVWASRPKGLPPPGRDRKRTEPYHIPGATGRGPPSCGSDRSATRSARARGVGAWRPSGSPRVAVGWSGGGASRWRGRGGSGRFGGW